MKRSGTGGLTTIERQQGLSGRLLETAKIWGRTALPGCVAAMGGALAALALLADDGLAQANDSRVSQGGMRLAAVGEERTGVPDRLGARPSDDHDGLDLRILLAQNAPAAAAEAQSRRDVVLVAFPISTPPGVEDEVAKEHGLEIIGRWELPRFELRMVQIRVPPGRSATAVVEQLRGDRRVKSAQTGVTYRPAGLDNQAKAQPEEEEAGTKSESGLGPPSARSYGIAAPLDQGGSVKAAAPSARKALAAKTRKTAATSVSAPGGVQWLTTDEPFIGADGRLR